MDPKAGTSKTDAVEHSCSSITFHNPKTNSPIRCSCGALDKLKNLNLVFYNTEFHKRGTSATSPFFKGPPRDPKTIHCKFYLRNACTTADCQYRHDPIKLKAVEESRGRNKALYTWVRPGLVFTNSKYQASSPEGSIADLERVTKEAKKEEDKPQESQPSTSTPIKGIKPGFVFSCDWADDDDEDSSSDDETL